MSSGEGNTGEEGIFKLKGIACYMQLIGVRILSPALLVSGWGFVLALLKP